MSYGPPYARTPLGYYWAYVWRGQGLRRRNCAKKYESLVVGWTESTLAVLSGAWWIGRESADLQGNLNVYCIRSNFFRGVFLDFWVSFGVSLGWGLGGFGGVF